MTNLAVRRAAAALLAAGAILLGACQEAQAPATFRVVELQGGAYERGLQHGRRFPSEIRSLYTRMLTSSTLPYLNRERPDIAATLEEYRDARYDDGQFAGELMLQSARAMEPFIPDDALDEMHGVADGAGLPYDEILVLNTFLDAMLTLRSLTVFLRGLEGPVLLSVDLGAGLSSDGIDNDGDGEIDEDREGVIDPYEPLPHAALVEVPVDATVRFVLIDQPGAAATLGHDAVREPEGVDPGTIRLQVDTTVIEAGDPQLTTRPVTTPRGEGLEVTFTPAGGLPPASVVSLLLSAGDRSLVTDPPPAHARFMRDERIVLSTTGLGRRPDEIDNRGERDGRTQPPSIGFVARGSATASGAPLLAHHFALLDANTAHEHTALFVHHADEGHDYVVLGWTGLVWGFSGMNDAGLSYGVACSDSLDNGMMVDVAIHLANLERARLVDVGVPIGILGRAVLSGAESVEQAATLLDDQPRTTGWNMLLADREGGALSLEMDSNILGDGGIVRIEPAGASSVGPDDLRMASHFVLNADDIAQEPLRPQRAWSGFYFRSLRASSILGERIEDRLGSLDVAAAEQVLSDPDLVDPRDSMSAVVFEPQAGRLHVAMGQVPATRGEFRPFALADFFGAGAAP